MGDLRISTNVLDDRGKRAIGTRVSKEVAEQVFEYAGKRGTGLGLYVCKEIIEKQGGKIWAESQEGKWARFTFALPKK